MKIKRIKIEGFRCLKKVDINLEDDLTLIVGENDSGKSSVIDALNIITQNKNIDNTDFNYDTDIINLEIEIDNYVFIKTYKKGDQDVTLENFVAKPTKTYISNLKVWLEDEELDLEENESTIKDIAKTFGLTVRSNSNINNLKDNLLDLINTNIDNAEFEIKNATFPKFNNIQLNGRQFENVSTFFKEVFLREKQSNIWQEKINHDETIEEFITKTLNEYSKTISEQIKDNGIFDKLKLYLQDLSDIKIIPEFMSKELNINARVIFLENGGEINLEKKGDGTKRRITMALLEFKKDQDLLESDQSTIYLLDEPDTHLHVKAQIELLDTMRSFTQDNNQVIITSHSPFLINSVNPRQIRLLENTYHDTKVRRLKDNIDSSDRLLKNLGIENVYLFFSRWILIVEGETEESFIPAFYLRKTGRSIKSNLIRIINSKGINNIVGFSSAILELHNRNNISIVYDNDATEDLTELITSLEIPDERKFIIGNKEFEDAFDSIDIYNAWRAYLEESNKEIPQSWTVDNIEDLKKECISDTRKFSKELRSLNAGGKKMTKPLLGRALGEYVPLDKIPNRLKEMFEKL
jgi:predicted ATP-dependent endonuclease of OLD family